MTDRSRSRDNASRTSEVQQLRRDYDSAFHRFASESRSLHRLQSEPGADAEALRAAERSFEEASQRYHRRRNTLADRLLNR